MVERIKFPDCLQCNVGIRKQMGIPMMDDKQKCEDCINAQDAKYAEYEDSLEYFLKWHGR